MVFCTLSQANTEDPRWTPCNHAFDKDHIEFWLTTHNICPARDCHRTLSAADLRTTRKAMVALEMHQHEEAQAAPRNGWSRRRWCLTAAVVVCTVAAVATGVFLAVFFHKKDHHKPSPPTPAPPSPSPTNSPAPLDPNAVCDTVFNGPSYVSLYTEGLFKLFSATVDADKALLCPNPVLNSTVVQSAGQVINTLGKDIASSIASGGSNATSIFVSNCFTNSGDAASPIGNVTVLYSLDLSSMQAAAYSCAQGLCRRNDTLANFAPDGTTYTCSNIFDNVKGLVSQLGSILIMSRKK